MMATQFERNMLTQAPAAATPSIAPAAITPAARSSLAKAPYVREPRNAEDEEAADQARSDFREGLTYSHEHVKRLLGPDWRKVGTAQTHTPGVALAIVWTRTADMMHLGDRTREFALHHALERFAAQGIGTVFAQLRPHEYRLDADGFRVHFLVDGSKMVILSVRSD